MAARLYLLAHLLEGLSLTGAEDEVGASVGEGLGHVAAQAPPAAGHDGCLAVEAEEVKRVQGSMPPSLCRGRRGFRRGLRAHPHPLALLVGEDAPEDLAD